MGGFKLVINSVAYDKDRGFLILYLEEALVPGKDLRIEIAFLGEDHLLSNKNSLIINYPFISKKTILLSNKIPFYQIKPLTNKSLYFQRKPVIAKSKILFVK